MAKPPAIPYASSKAAVPATASPPKFFRIIPPTSFDFIAWGRLFYGLSGLLAAGTIWLLWLRGGPPLGIDFRGGIIAQFSFERNPGIEKVRSALNKSGLESQVQSVGQGAQFLARFKKEEEDHGLDEKLGIALASVAGAGSHQVLSKEYVGAVVGERLKDQAVKAILLSFLGIIVYVGFRFQNLVWGVAGVVAIIHDVFLSVGFLTLLGYEIDLVVVAGLLTLAGYSINDTVVVFDRLRERRRVYPRETLMDAINKAENDTLGRTLITAGATFLSVLALAAWGGTNLRAFSMTLAFGIIVGSYSTIGIASNLVYAWANWTGLKAR